MKTLLSLLLCLPLLTYAQVEKGIKFEENLSWEQVKAKAKSDNKYIFLDCFTTWCGPCKRMDKEVYTNDKVGNYFNDKFISVKVQMDKTEKDITNVQRWYSDANLIKKQYKIIAFPSYLFFTPEGTIVHKEMGFKLPAELIAIAQTATSPGNIYNDPYAAYDSLLKEYELGNKDYTKMLYMIKTATELRDTGISNKLRRDYNNYLLNLTDKELYTRKNLEYIASVVHSKSKFFPMFFPNGSRVDDIMKKKGYAEAIVDQVILYEIINTFLDVKQGMIRISRTENEKEAEPDWQKLYNIIKNKYSDDYAKRNLLEAQIIWHEQQLNYDAFATLFITKWKKYGLDTTDSNTDGRLNAVAWTIYLNCTDKSHLNAALTWMQGVVRRNYNTKYPTWKVAMIDTYACLLYKSGKKKDAIHWQEKAVDIASKELPDDPIFTEVRDRLYRMKKGEPKIDS